MASDTWSDNGPSARAHEALGFEIDFLVVVFLNIGSFYGRCRTLLSKVLADFRRNLAIRHLVNCFNTCDPSAQLVPFKTFLQFALCLTRTKYQNGFRITDARNYRSVVNVEMPRKGSLSAIICRYMLWFIGTPKG